MASQRFCLRWNNHQSNLLSVFDQLLHAETFTDVTLAVEGQYLKAHKMVLSACSPYFNALFVNHPEKHPIVILKDVPYSDMKSLLDFMYRGEVSVDQQRLTAFLRVAESLRIKGLTEVNDDKPSGAAPTPPPPQLHRIQPYLVQQRTKSQNLLSMNNNQPSLLGTALSSMPKRKRGRPRKLSGSSNGTGNDFDEYDRDGMLQHSPKQEIKMSGDGYSGNEGSDDNQRESFDNDQDMNDCTDSRDGRSKKHKSQSKDRINNDNDNSTSVHLNSSPELSQRLFGVNKQQQQQQPPPASTAPSSMSTMTVIQSAAHTPTKQVSNSTPVIQIPPQMTVAATPKKSVPKSAPPPPPPPPPQQQQQQPQQQIPEILDPATHLPTALGLKIRVHPITQTNHQQNLNSNSTASLLQKQLRNDPLSNNNNSNKNNNSSSPSDISNNQQLERQLSSNDSNTIQPPSSNNLHHQFLLHMATNPIVKTEYLLKNESNNDENVMPIDASSPQPNSNAQNDKSEIEGATPTIIDLLLSPPTPNDNATQQQQAPDESPPVTPRNQRPVQRRRIRRKAQSTLDDQAEHLTEMSVRGLDLFRYASITEGVYQCTECAKENVQKTFKNKYSFQRHAFLYHEGKHRKVFPCPVCGKEFSRPDKMKNHMKMTHEGFVPKDAGYHPLNYLITAAAAGEIPHLFHQIDQHSPPAGETNSANTDGVTITSQHPPPPPPLIKLKNDLHVIRRHAHESSPSPPPLSSQEDGVNTAQEKVK